MDEEEEAEEAVILSNILHFHTYNSFVVEILLKKQLDFFPREKGGPVHYLKGLQNGTIDDAQPIGLSFH